MHNPQSSEGHVEKTATIKAEDIAPAARQWVASVLHVNLGEGDEVTLALHRAAEDAQATERSKARKRLLDLLSKMDEKTSKASDTEMDEAVEEAMRFVRPSYGG